MLLLLLLLRPHRGENTGVSWVSTQSLERRASLLLVIVCEGLTPLLLLLLLLMLLLLRPHRGENTVY
jgi:hypothetical protein